MSMRRFSPDAPIAIIGAGVMGTKVAWACARAGIPTRLFDIDSATASASLDRARSWSEGNERQRVEQCLVLVETLERAVDAVQLAFENVPEDLQLKRKVLGELMRAIPEDAYLGSNASSLTVTPLAADLSDPDRFFLLNFTDPRYHSLVELMTQASCPEETIAFARQWAAGIGMIPIHTRKEQLGYAFNRLWRVIKKEVLRQVSEGVILPEEIDKAWMLTFGTPYGPCGLMDEIGLKGIRNVERIYHLDSGDPTDAPPAFLDEMIERGETGILAGKGFYDYPNPAYKDDQFLEK